MKEIFKDALSAVAGGARFSVDLVKRSFKLNGKWVILNGQYETPLGVPDLTQDETLYELERLYGVYRHSVPSERSDSARSRYFNALPASDMENDDWLFGESRTVAQCAVELFTLISVIKGNLKWEWPTQWFYQSKTDPSLVLLRQWIA